MAAALRKELSGSRRRPIDEVSSDEASAKPAGPSKRARGATPATEPSGSGSMSGIGNSPVRSPYADFKPYPFVRDAWDALPKERQTMKHMYGLLSEAIKGNAPDQTREDAVSSYLQTFRSNDTAERINILDSLITKKHDVVVNRTASAFKHVKNASIESFKDFQTFAALFPHNTTGSTPAERSRAGLIALSSLCFPPTPFQMELDKLWPVNNDEAKPPATSALAIDIFLAKKGRDPKELLDNENKIEAIKLAMNLRRELLGRNHKAFISVWRQARYELPLDEVLNVASQEVQVEKKDKKALQLFVTILPCLAAINKLSTAEVFSDSKRNELLQEFFTLLGRGNEPGFETCYVHLWDAFAKTPTIQQHINAAAQAIVKTEDDGNPLPHLSNPVIDATEEVSTFQTNVGQASAIPTLTLQQGRSWKAGTQLRPVGGDWEMRIFDRYPAHVDIQRMFNGFPIRDMAEPWHVAKEYAADDDKYAVHPDVVVHEPAISDEGMGVLKSWAEHLGDTTPIEELMARWTAEIMAEYEAPMQNRPPPSASVWEVVKIEEKHCYYPEQYEALKGGYGVACIPGAKQKVNSMIMPFGGAQVEDKKAFTARYGENYFDNYAMECAHPEEPGKTVHVAPVGSRAGMFNGKADNDRDDAHVIVVDVFIELTDKHGNRKKHVRPHLYQVKEVPPNKQALMDYLGNYFEDRRANAASGASSSGAPLIKQEPQD